MEIKLIEASHWTLWKFQVKIVIQSHDAWDVVTGIEKPPVKKDGFTDYDAALKAYNKKDVSAQRVIVTTIGEKPLLHIVNCNSAHEMWTKLSAVFEQKRNTFPTAKNLFVCEE